MTRAVNAGCGLACTIHANSASEALDALANAALMAGENVPERVVKKVFSASVDLVVHLDRRFDTEDSRIRRETMEIRAVVPSLHDDFSTEPLFVRERLGTPLRWTGALPPEGLIQRLESASRGRTSVVSVLKGGGQA